MERDHRYDITLEWTGNRGEGTSNYKAYTRDYSLIADGKADILGSSDPVFMGDPARHNPEDLFVASVSSCHMLWYLHLASVAGIIVTGYRDAAFGVMQEQKNGAGEFSSITLRPHVTITDPSRADDARAIHDKVGHYCFIARSIKTPIHHDVIIEVEGA